MPRSRNRLRNATNFLSWSTRFFVSVSWTKHKYIISNCLICLGLCSPRQCPFVAGNLPVLVSPQKGGTAINNTPMVSQKWSTSCARIHFLYLGLKMRALDSSGKKSSMDWESVRNSFECTIQGFWVNAQTDLSFLWFWLHLQRLIQLNAADLGYRIYRLISLSNSC